MHPLLRPLLRSSPLLHPLRRRTTATIYQPRPKFLPRHFLLTFAFILTTSLTSVYITKLALPMSGPIPTGPPPRPGSLEELEELAEIEAAANDLPIVKELRANPEFVERRAWEGFSEEERKKKFAAGTLVGSVGIGLNWVWLNTKDASSVSVVRLGRAICGFPGVVHGGVLATLMDEAIGRTVMEVFPGRNGVTAKLSVNYRRPTLEGNFVVLRTWLIESNERKATAAGRIEDEDGNVLVEAEGIFVVPKSWQLEAMPEGI